MKVPEVVISAIWVNRWTSLIAALLPVVLCMPCLLVRDVLCLLCTVSSTHMDFVERRESVTDRSVANASHFCAYMSEPRFSFCVNLIDCMACE